VLVPPPAPPPPVVEPELEPVDEPPVVVETIPEPPPAPVAPPPLPLILMGIAEQPSASGAQRTAILGGSGDEIYMVTVGQTIAARYTVTAVGVDAIELKDLSTGGLRRLALR